MCPPWIIRKKEKRFEVVYELFSSKTAERFRVKAALAEKEKIPTVQFLWKTADWFEREAYDMFGVVFENHPNMRRFLTHHQFKGHPLRKDYPADYQQHCTETLPLHLTNPQRNPKTLFRIPPKKKKI